MEKIINSNNPAMSEDVRAISTALLLAKNEFLATGLAGENTHQRYKYAKIGDIYHAVDGALAKNNIIILHFARPVDGVEYLHTRLIHTLSGQFIEDCRILESEKAGNQGKGAANTYMRKYALLSLCALTTEDDDGEEEDRYVAKRAQEPFLSNECIILLQSIIKASTNGKELYNNILKFNKVKDLSELRMSSFESIKSYIANNRE
jgi:ERF superfamily